MHWAQAAVVVAAAAAVAGPLAGALRTPSCSRRRRWYVLARVQQIHHASATACQSHHRIGLVHSFSKPNTTTHSWRASARRRSCWREAARTMWTPTASSPREPPT